MTEACLTAETEPYPLDFSRLLLHLMSQAAGRKKGRFAIEEQEEEEEVWM